MIPFLRLVAEEEEADLRCRIIQLLVHLVGVASPRWLDPLLSVINSVSLTPHLPHPLTIRPHTLTRPLRSSKRD